MLIGKRVERLGQKFKRGHLDSPLAGAGDKDSTLASDDIAQIEKIENVEELFADIVALDINLHLTAGVAQIGEEDLPHLADQHDASADSYYFRGLLESFKVCENLCSLVGSLIAIGIGVDTHLGQLANLLAPDPDEIG